MSGFWVSSRGGAEPSSAFLILASLTDVGRKSAGAAAITTASAEPAAASTSVRSCSVVSTRTTLTPAGSGSAVLAATRVTSAPRDGGGPGQRVALEPRGAVAEEADRVEVLAGAAGRHHHLAAGQVRACRDAAREHVDAHVVDLVGLGQPALAGVGAGQPALGGLDDQAAALAQGRDVGLGGGVLPHLGVHRGREHDRAPGGEQGVGEQVVGQAVRGLGQQVGGGRARPRPGRPTGRSGRAGPRGRSSHTSVATGLPDSAAQVGAPTKCSAAAVGTTVTSWPDSVNRRSSSAAL